MTEIEFKAAKILGEGEYPDNPKHGAWRGQCMVAWLKAAGIKLIADDS